MGIKRLERKYSTPRHLWRSERIYNEAELMEKYGLKNHREIWKVLFKLSRWRGLARHLITTNDPKTTDEFLNSLINIGCLKEKTLESVFEISPNDVLERRLQTLVFRKNLAQTMRQARHFITHKHIFINNKVVNVPSYIVRKDEEDKITCDLVVDPSTDTKVRETFTKGRFRTFAKKKKKGKKHRKNMLKTGNK